MNIIHHGQTYMYHKEGTMKRQVNQLFVEVLLASFLVAAGPVVAADGVYEVVYPYGHPSIKVLPPVNRPDTLEGKTICGIFGGQFHFEETWPVMKEILAKKYPTAKFVDPKQLYPGSVIGKIPGGWDARNPQLVANILKQNKCDVAIVGNGC